MKSVTASPDMVGDAQQRAPSVGRDSSWLVGADLVAVGLAFLGQIILARMLLPEQYGWMVIAIDVYASLFLIVDLGLPTLLARDGAHAPDLVPQAVHRMYRYQLAALLPFTIMAILLRPDTWLIPDMPLALTLAALVTAIAHVGSYAPRSGLRVMGEARWEAMTKVAERSITVLAYGLLAFLGVTEASAYLWAFCGGALVGWLAPYLLVRVVAPSASTKVPDWTRLGPIWRSHRSLILASLPFAITLGVLPYVVRIEKFLVTFQGGSELAAVFHVAQLAWLAGLVVPSALRAALLPVLGEARGSPVPYRQALNTSLDLCLGLLPVGLAGGYLTVAFLAPVAFPSEYFDGTFGASAVDLFTVMLWGWAFTLLATPTYTAVMTSPNPWRFTLFIFMVLLSAIVIGTVAVTYIASTSEGWLFAGAVASTLSAGVLLMTSWLMSGEIGWVQHRSDEWGLAMLCTAFVIVGLATSTWWWMLGLPLVAFIPGGLRALRSMPP